MGKKPAGKGPKIAPRATKDPIQVLSSGVTKMVAFVSINLGKTGDGHPKFVPDTIKVILAEQNEILLFKGDQKRGEGGGFTRRLYSPAVAAKYCGKFFVFSL